MDELQKEKTDLEKKIAEKQKEIDAATTDIYWLRKRLKVTESHISARQSDGETLKEISEGMK